MLAPTRLRVVGEKSKYIVRTVDVHHVQFVRIRSPIRPNLIDRFAEFRLQGGMVIFQLRRDRAGNAAHDDCPKPLRDKGVGRFTRSRGAGLSKMGGRSFAKGASATPCILYTNGYS
jgi:hypothetical protein